MTGRKVRPFRSQALTSRGADRARHHILRVRARIVPRVQRQLSPRETETLTLLARGFNCRQAAEALGLKTVTVDCYAQSALAKSGMRNRAQLLLWFVRTYGEPSCIDGPPALVAESAEARPAVASSSPPRPARRRRRKPECGTPLSRREASVLEMLAAGNSTLETATALGLKPRGVKFHVSNAMAKSGTRNRFALARWFEQSGKGVGDPASAVRDRFRQIEQLKKFCAARLELLFDELSSAALAEFRSSITDAQKKCAQKPIA
ncbi:MAG TPA: LuxR C-terminal-related transcriptional regulator [Candidatus Acidoferrales bacterium]|nr:LuxR C-terminal-related transcriptional regulator [Candidatus Acidoferrales bacterium]